MIHSRAAADIHFHLPLQENVTCPEVCCNSEWRQTATRQDQHRHHHSAGKYLWFRWDSGQIFVHFWSSHQQFIYLYFMLIVHLVCFRCSNVCSCIVAVCRAESCSVVFSYNVVQLPCCFFLPVFAELCSRRTGLSKVFLFFSTRLIFKVCNSEDIFTVNAFFFLVEGEIYCHFYQCTV